MQSSSNSTLDRLLRWVKEGTRLYEEDEKFDVCRPNKSTLIHYHDAEKGKEKGSVEHQMMIFSIMSPACVSKLGWSCGRLSMDRTAPPEYYFQTVLRRVGMDVCRRAKQVPLSALFQRGWAYTPMFDIDVKETEAPFTNEILLEWGRLIVSTLLEFYPNCRWTPGIPFLVCSKPESQAADTRVVCSHCSSSEYEIRGNVLRCLKCKRTGPPLEKQFYKIGAHFDFCQYRDPWCRTLLQDVHEDEDGNIVYTGSAPTVKTSQMLQVREALVQKIVCMDKDGWKAAGAGGTANLHLRHRGREDLRVRQDGRRPFLDGAWHQREPEAVLRGQDQVVLVQGRGGAPDRGKQVRRRVRALFGDGGVRQPRPKVRAGTPLGCCGGNGGGGQCQRQVRRREDDGPASPDVAPRPRPGLCDAGVRLPKGGYHQAETDIVVGEDSTEKDRHRNNLLVGLQPMDNVGNTRLAKRRAPNGGDARAKKRKFAPSDQMHFSLSSSEGVRVRNTIQAVVRRIWNEYLGNTYVGNYCMCYVDRASRERSVYIVNIAGQGAGRCPNALHCECGLQRDRCRRPPATARGAFTVARRAPCTSTSRRKR